jgi:hypothetical protein
MTKKLKHQKLAATIEADSTEWWKDKLFIEELDRRYDALESGKDVGVTMQQLEKTIKSLAKKRKV